MVSVIIPIYNVERYLKQCLKSVLNQTYKDMELILVNDASPDGSLTICKQFAERDPRITIIDKKVNEGVDMARFSGLDAAKGEYIYFIDPDDWLARRDIIELMVNKADETGVDYVMMNYQKVIGRHALIKTKYKRPLTGFISRNEIMEKIYPYLFGWPLINPCLWSNLYRKSVIVKSGIRPSGIKFGQDLVFNLRLTPYLNSIYIMNNSIIGYNYRFGGLTHTYNPKSLTAQKSIFTERIKESIKNNRHKSSILAMQHLLAYMEANTILLTSTNHYNAKEVLREELEDPFWDEVLQPEKYPDMFQTPFMQALAARDIDRMIELSLPAAKRHRRMARIKKIANAILSRI